MRKSLSRGILALIVSVVAWIILSGMVKRPRLLPVVVVTQPVSAGTTLTPAELGTALWLAPLPPGVVTNPATIVGEITQMPLAPGQTLTLADVGHRYLGLPRGTVAMVLPVAAAQSALVQPGDYVDVVALPSSGTGSNGVVPTAPTAHTVATHLLVLGVYSSSGSSVTASGAAGQAPGLVKLAVTPRDAITLAPLAGANGTAFWLVRDPRQLLHS
jgi:Flp pilus assembly protein CpaB